MNWRVGVWIGVLVFALGVGGISYFTAPSPRGWLDGHAKRVAADEWTSEHRPSVVAERLDASVKASGRVDNPWGIVLRYSRSAVTITPEGNGSRIFLDHSRRWRSYGIWRGSRFAGGDGVRSGPTSGPSAPPIDADRVPIPEAANARRAEDFRGGGPGSGK